MRFSLLLPTKNRLEYLRYAVESVRRQDFEDWEIVVSDNWSEDDVEGYVRSVGDPRIRCVRPDRPLPVTEHWNFALGHAGGDYVLMLGDDDALLRGHLRIVDQVAREFDVPDMLYTGAHLFSYPGAEPAWPRGYLLPYGYATFLRDRRFPFVLDRTQARGVVDDFLRFRCTFGFNAQFMLFSRSLLERLLTRGPVYQSPFPDYYVANAAMLESHRIVVVPAPLVAIGVTPKSYGHFHSEGHEAEGMAFLGQGPEPAEAARLQEVVLPGTNINTSWLYAAETLCRNFPDIGGLSCSHRAYRTLQIIDCYQRVHVQGEDGAELSRLRQRLRWNERVATRLVLDPFVMLTRRHPRVRARGLGKLRTLQRQYLAWKPARVEDRYQTILDVVDDVDPVTLPA